MSSKFKPRMTTGAFVFLQDFRPANRVSCFPRMLLAALPASLHTCLNEYMAVGGQIRVGTAGWSYKDWEGILYPAGMSRRKQHPLEILARCFDMVEINTSFYGHIKPEIAKLWAKIAGDANQHFLFTAKLHRSFTHSPLSAMEPTSAVSIHPNRALEADRNLNVAGDPALREIRFKLPHEFRNAHEFQFELSVAA